MSFTTIKALVNMTNRPATLQNRETNAGVATDAYEAKQCNIVVPWCTSSGEFPGHHLRLEFKATSNPPDRFFTIYSIWQEDISGADRVRFTEYIRIRGAIDPPYSHGARGLINARNGSEYIVSGNSDAILVIDERLWVILVRI